MARRMVFSESTADPTLKYMSYGPQGRYKPIYDLSADHSVFVSLSDKKALNLIRASCSNIGKRLNRGFSVFEKTENGIWGCRVVRNY